MGRIKIKQPRKINITDKVIQEWLAKGTLVHIHGNKHGDYKNEIMQSIFVVEIPWMDNDQKPLTVAIKAIRHEKDRPNKKIANKILVGRLIRKVIEHRTNGKDYFIPHDWEDIDNWIGSVASQHMPQIMLVEPSIKNYDEVRDMVKRYKDNSENTQPMHL